MDDFDEDSMQSTKPSPKHRITMPSLPTISAAENSTDSSAASESGHQRSPLSLHPLPAEGLERSNRSAASAGSLDKSHQSMSGYSMDDFDEESMGGAGASMSAMSTYSQTFETDYSTRFDEESTAGAGQQQVQMIILVQQQCIYYICFLLTSFICATGGEQDSRQN
jgi:hypothetical protein